MQGYRFPLDQLCQVDHELANLLQTLSIELEYLSISPRTGSLDHAGPMQQVFLDAQIQRHHIISEEWEKVVKQI